MTKSPEILKEKWEDLTRRFPKIRVKNAAEKLGVSEVELLATNLDNGVTQLNPDFKEIISSLKNFGEVNIVSRNNDCIAETKGTFENFILDDSNSGKIVSGNLNLNLFFNEWKFAFAVDDEEGKSIQFFNHQGNAVLKVYLTAESDETKFEELTLKFKSETKIPELEIEDDSKEVEVKTDEDVDKTGLGQDWKNMENLDDFDILLKKYGISKTQAYRLAPEQDFAKKISNKRVVKLLDDASKSDFPLTIVVKNKGVSQSNAVEVQNTMWHGSWKNIMNPDFNLHLDIDAISELWVVRKPTNTGIITSVEAFNNYGECIVQFYGNGESGVPELNEWRKLVYDLTIEL